MKNISDIGKKPFFPKKSLHIIGIIVASILTLIVLFIYLFPQNLSPLNSNQDFIFKTVKNKEFHIKAFKNHFQIKELKGKVVFLKVFGWNCKYCQKEIPELIKLKDKFKTAFDTIAIEYQHHSNKKNLDFIQKYHIDYNIINGDEQISFLDYLKQEYDWDGVIPMTIVIGTDGKILAFEVGYKSYSLTTLLQTTLQLLTSVALPQDKGEK